MPQGNETSNVKIGDVKKLVEQALGIHVREGQVRSKKIGKYISANTHSKDKIRYYLCQKLKFFKLIKEIPADGTCRG